MFLPGDPCLEGLCPGGSLSKGSLSCGLSPGVSVQGVCVGDFCPGRYLSGVLCLGVCQEDTPPPRTKTFLYGKERAVRILLDCFLVTFCDNFKGLFTPAFYHAVTITISLKNGL